VCGVLLYEYIAPWATCYTALQPLEAKGKEHKRNHTKKRQGSQRVVWCVWCVALRIYCSLGNLLHSPGTTAATAAATAATKTEIIRLTGTCLPRLTCLPVVTQKELRKALKSHSSSSNSNKWRRTQRDHKHTKKGKAARG